MRRTFLKQLTLAGITASFFPRFSKAAPLKSEKLFIHHVLFWLQDGENPAVRSKFKKALEELGSIPLIKFLHIGTPADTNREIIDSSYHYSFLIGFDDKADHDAYQLHPIHDKFRNEYSDMWTRVLIYDSINAK